MEAQAMGSRGRIQGKIYAGLLAGLMLSAALSWGQNTINARVTGGNNGKCTFEVRVDGVANVQIRGNQGYIQTKTGMPAQWVRLQCTQPLPRNPNNFRFAGVDGRGKQYLFKNPSGNNGVAIIRIEDNRSGMEGYTGDIFWNGGNNNGGNWNGGWWNDNWNGGGGWGGGGGGGGYPPPGGGNGQWNNKLVPNCQNNIRNKFNQQMRGAQLNFVGSPSLNQGGSFVMVNGNANVRDNQGRMGQIAYRCTMHPNGNVADSSYNFNNGNFNPQAR
jgi:hypothetical protein